VRGNIAHDAFGGGIAIVEIDAAAQQAFLARDLTALFHCDNSAITYTASRKTPYKQGINEFFNVLKKQAYQAIR
jgi:hypothetical protein